MPHKRLISKLKSCSIKNVLKVREFTWNRKGYVNQYVIKNIAMLLYGTNYLKMLLDQNP